MLDTGVGGLWDALSVRRGAEQRGAAMLLSCGAPWRGLWTEPLQKPSSLAQTLFHELSRAQPAAMQSLKAHLNPALLS